jgi:hypothetical protein
MSERLNSKNNGSRTLQMVAIIIVSALLLAVGASLLQRTQAFVASALPATATVIEMEAVRSGGTRSVYRPHIQFIVSETSYTFVSGSGEYPPAYSVGDQVDILYNPANPAQAMSAREASIGSNPLFLGFLGLGVVGVGVGVIGILRIVMHGRQ